MGDYSHVFRISLVAILLVILGWLAPRWWRPASYGEIGPYRAENLGENIHLDFVVQERQTCRPCHQEIFLTHQKDVHITVQCENCHGAADKHIAFHQGFAKTLDINQTILGRENAHRNCLFCHLKLTARPLSFPQIDLEFHFAFHHVTSTDILCTTCHDPHEPLFLLMPFEDAKIHPLANQCRDCHNPLPEKNHTEVSNHPAVLPCQQCHPNIVTDFDQRPHGYLPCGGCHKLFQKNETDARIQRSTNKKYCLMCHQNPAILEHQHTPQIIFAEHVREKAQIMDLNPQDLESNKTACLLCHGDIIHDPNLLEQVPEIIR